MSLSRALLLAGSVAGASFAAPMAIAFAADMPNYPPASTLPPPTTLQRPQPYVQNSANWYLRGDLGYRFNRTSGADAAPGFAGPDSSELGSSVSAGLGFGVKTEWLRTDITADFATAAKYEATIAAPGDTSAKISASSVLFNGYLDLGTWYRMSPYIGAGAGAAYLNTTDYSSTASPPFTAGTSHARWNLAWALMAGVGYQIAPNMMVDLGYRYLNLGDATSGSDTFGSMTIKNVAAHEVRVGLRWSFNDFPISR